MDQNTHWAEIAMVSLLFLLILVFAGTTAWFESKPYSARPAADNGMGQDFPEVDWGSLEAEPNTRMQ